MRAKEPQAQRNVLLVEVDAAGRMSTASLLRDGMISVVAVASPPVEKAARYDLIVAGLGRRTEENLQFLDTLSKG